MILLTLIPLLPTLAVFATLAIREGNSTHRATMEEV